MKDVTESRKDAPLFFWHCQVGLQTKEHITLAFLGTPPHVSLQLYQQGSILPKLRRKLFQVTYKILENRNLPLAPPCVMNSLVLL